MDPINFYFLSSGFCGTRFHHHALRLATNAEVWHQPGHEDISDITNLMEQRFDENRNAFLQTELQEFPYFKRRIDKRLALPWIYGDTLNWMRGLGYMLYRYIGPKRLRLVELVRHPAATCRSMLAHYRDSSPVDSSDIDLAEEIARRWVRQYSLIRYQFKTIDDPAVCRTLHLENTSLGQLRDLYEFLGLEGYDEAAVKALLEERSLDVRHSHLLETPVPASKEELRAIWRVCKPLAGRYGYVENEAFYDDAPSRPARKSSTVLKDDYSTQESPLVKLFDYRGLGLLIRCSSGINYINQAGGPICFGLHAEGAFVPLTEPEEDSVARKLFNYFHLRRRKEFMSSIQHEDADFIDAVLAEHGFEFITINRSRIGEEWDLFSWQTWTNLSSAPWEAWVPVQVRRIPFSRLSGSVSGIDDEEAILIWENSN